MKNSDTHLKARRRPPRRVTWAVAILLSPLVFGPAGIGAAVADDGVDRPGRIPAAVERQINEILQKEGKVRVIVRLQPEGRVYRLESELGGEEVGRQRAAIARAQENVESELTSSGFKVNRTYKTLPFIALTVDERALDRLRNSPRVESIELDDEGETQLNSTSDWIGSGHTWDADFGGQGMAVAILDTGIDADHPFFGGGGANGNVNRVVDEACFSTNDANTLCPNGMDAQYGPGAADVVNVANCYVGGAVGSGNQICDHGTHVAGIAAGQDDGTAGFDGVAPKAGIIAVQVFHRVADCDDDTPGNQPCVRFFGSNLLRGLDWINDFASVHHTIVSANMSLGGGMNFEPCTGSAIQTAFQSLRAKGIAPVVSAGNDGWTWATGSPGCIPEAVTVGSVWDTDAPLFVGTQSPDDVLHNLAYFVDLMAVGASVDSSIPDDAYGSKFGTSMATPQVTGAFAVIRSIVPSWTVDQVEQLLKDTGSLVMDQRPAFPLAGDDDYPNPCDPPACQPRTGQVKPRLQLDAALAALTSADLRIFKDCKPDGAKPIGEDAICHLRVTNHGPAAAMDVQVVDSYVSDGSANFTVGPITVTPAGAGTCSTTPNPQNPSGKVTCDLNAMQKDAVVDIAIRVRANTPLNVNNEAVVTALTPDPSLGNNTATDGLTFADPGADLKLVKLCKPDGAVVAGGSYLCTLLVDNLGPSSASGVVLTDALVTNGAITVSNITTSQGACAINPGPPLTISCNLGTVGLSPGGRVTVSYEVTAADPADVNNDALVTADTADPDPSNNQAHESLTFVAAATDLKVTKICKPDGPITVEEWAECTILVDNLGPAAAVNVRLQDFIAHDPKTTLRVRDLVASQGSCTPVPNAQGNIDRNVNFTIDCALGMLAAGDRATVSYRLKSLDKPQDVNNDALVTSDTVELDAANNQAHEHISIVGPSADVVVTKALVKVAQVKAMMDPTRSAHNITYRVVVKNKGPDAAEEVVLTDILPFTEPNFWILLRPAECDVYVPAEHKLVCRLGTLAAKEKRTLRFRIQAFTSHINGLPSFTNTATATSVTPDPKLFNNTSQVTTATPIVVFP